MAASHPSPEEKYLQRKLIELAELETLLAERELELHTMRGGVLAFEKQYESVIGPKFAELDELRFQIAERSPQAAAPVKESQDPATRPAAAARPRSRGKPTPPPRTPPKPEPPRTSSFAPSDALKKLYRDVAKALHPDLADDESGRALRHQYMIRANEAYEAADEARLRVVMQEWEHCPEAVQGSGTGADLVRAIRKIDRCESRLFTITREIEQIQSTAVFGMKSMSDEAEQFERDLLTEMSSRLDADIAAAKAMLAGLPAVPAGASGVAPAPGAPTPDAPAPP